jgi:hypothetical protein
MVLAPKRFPPYHTAHRAFVGIMAPGRAMFTSKIDDLQVQFVPFILWEEPLAVFLSLHYVFSIGKPPAVYQAMNVCVNRKSQMSKSLRHHHRGGLVPYTR